MKGCFELVLYIFAGLVVLGVIVAIFGGPSGQSGRSPNTGSQSQSASSSGSSATSVPDTPTPEWMAPSFEEMCGNDANMTDVQQEDYAAAMAGKKIVGWVGAVYDVERAGDTYTVQVNMNPGGLFKSRQIEILGLSREVAGGLNVDQMIAFDGTIQAVEMFAGGLCNPIKVVEATITPQ